MKLFLDLRFLPNKMSIKLSRL